MIAVLLGLSSFTLSAMADLSTITQAPPATHTLDARQAQSSSSYPTNSPLPLTDYFYPYSAIPYQVNPYATGRGPQSGYNQCNATTEGADSQCQTAIVNSIDDFCLWGAPGLSPNQSIGDVEAAVVAYCSRSGHGSRIFPPGTFTAVQFMKTEAYIQVVGLFNQTAINLSPDDGGGELDPHGADFAGNPLGGLVYSTGLPTGDNTTYQQTESWNNFVGSNQFCFKLCDPNYKGDNLNYCQNIYDLIGCTYNMPAAYAPGAFLSCEGDLQDEVGTYTSNGATYTWSQPSTLDPSSTLPWTPRIPASSNCVTYQSSDLFPLSALGYQNKTTAAAAAVTGGSSTGSGSSSGSATTTKSASTSMKTGSTSGVTGGTGAVAAATASSSTSAKSGAGVTVATSLSLVGLVAAGFTVLLI